MPTQNANAILYSRQRDINLTTPNCITVAGVGGIGSWVAILAAMSGVKNIYLFDDDVMEESNRNRLPFCQGSLNRPKVEIVKEYIDSIRPEAVIVAVPSKLEESFLDIQLRISNAVIDCTDSPKAQYTIYNACKAIQRCYIRAGYDGTHITVTSNVSGWIKIDEEQENYTVNPSWVVPAVTVAALAVGKLMKYADQEIGLDINEIGIPVVQKQKRLTARCVQTSASPRSRATGAGGTAQYLHRRR